ncbi:hypothetical protein AKO53_06465 [Brucella abortus]|nr:hypothetical protein BAA13334_I00441 [Brucella abortus A13334]AIN89551.1 hypothetical protein DM30_00035 [Brucella abortus]ALF28730.1 hypothetical protein NL70_00100 [Brucella abortus 104M]ERM05260.1 hypothetical protein P408_07770 [Brucella abortus S99]ERM85682.1 hypothetical protein P865_12625 [Brucella abortus 82]KDV07607.1 hypothetical protein BF16_12805 [Brucella suis 1330]KFH23996.1 hypothetical protein IB63_03345 [Brucella abortus 544]
MAPVGKGRIATLSDNRAEIPYKLPEPGAILYRPAMQRGIIRQAEAGMPFGANAELFEIAGRNARAIRLPQRIVMRRLSGDRLGAHHSSQKSS